MFAPQQAQAIVDRLTRVMDDEYVPVWLGKSIPALGDRTPLEAIGRGDYDAVARIVSALEDPPAS